MRTFITALLLLAIGVLALHGGPSTATSEAISAPPPYLAIEYDKGQLVLRGAVSSAGHREILEETVRRQFAGSNLVIDVTIVDMLPADWSLLSDLTLQSMAYTQSAVAEITVNAITIRGLTASADGWYAAIARLEKNLHRGTVLRIDVNPIAAGPSLTVRCRQLFAAALQKHHAEFVVGEHKLRPSSRALLDEMAELAFDCPGAVITIIGAGDEGSAMRQQAERRAAAIAAYLNEKGIAADRIRIGAASPQPGQRSRFEIVVN